jgi:TolB-like protein/Flp pilus assembly protein TadD
MDVLVFLAGHRGEVQPKERIIQQVWAGTFVTDDVLKHAISELRKALGDDARNPRYLETIARRGYRLTAVDAEPAGEIADVPQKPRRRRWALAGLGVFVLAAAGVFLALGAPELRNRVPRFFGHPRVQSLAVLPLKSFSSDPEQAFFTKGMTDALITELSRIGGLQKVTSLQSVLRYEGSSKPIPEIARELGVDALIEGSAQRDGQHVRITVQLIHGATDSHLWAENYDREYRDLPVLYTDVARSVAREINIALTPQEQRRLTTARPVNPIALEAVLTGQHLLRTNDAGNVPKAIQCFERAVAMDSRFADAYIGLGRAFIRLAISPGDGGSRSPAIGSARESAIKALALDPSNADAHRLLAVIRAQFDWDWAGAEKEYRAALTLNPNSADIHHSYLYFLSAMGRHEEAAAENSRARALDPLSLDLRTTTATRLLLEGRLEQATGELQKVLEIDPDSIAALGRLGMIQALRGNFAEAVRLSEKAAQISGGDITCVAGSGYVYALAGRTEDARAVLRRLEQTSRSRYVRSESFAWIHAALKQNDQAIAWLEKAYLERSAEMINIRSTPEYDNLRADPRFQDLVRRMKFPR